MVSRMLLILANPDIKSLHVNSCKIIILILETYNINSKFEFFKLISELIFTLEGELIIQYFSYNNNYY